MSTAIRLEKIKRNIRQIALTSGQIAMIGAIGFFVFEISQSWIRSEISFSVLVWVFPTIATLGIISLIMSLCFVFNSRKNHKRLLPAENLAFSILDYGIKLRSEGRDLALVNLRNNFSISLHILGFHKTRVQLGELAIQSATVINDNPTKSEILIDDLGWANHLLDNVNIAKQNIKRGIDIANKSKKRDKKNQLRLSLAEAKGLRHIAIIDYKEKRISERRLDRALSILTSLGDQSMLEIQRDIAQIHHARALISAMRLNVHKSGSIRKEDSSGMNMLDKALKEVRKASLIFKQIGDLDRYVKTLFLEVRLLEAKGAYIEAKEVSAIRDRTLAASEWATAEGKETITGK